MIGQQYPCGTPHVSGPHASIAFRQFAKSRIPKGQVGKIEGREFVEQSFTATDGQQALFANAAAKEFPLSQHVAGKDVAVGHDVHELTHSAITPRYGRFRHTRTRVQAAPPARALNRSLRLSKIQPPFKVGSAASRGPELIDVDMNDSFLQKEAQQIFKIGG